MWSTIGKSWKLLSRTHKYVLFFLSVGRVASNFLDILAITLVGIISAQALGNEVEIPFLSSLVNLTGYSIVLALSLASILFVCKTLIGIFLARLTAIYLADIEAEFSVKIASFLFGDGLTRLRQQSKDEIDWSVLRSSHIAITSVLGQAISLVAEASLALMIFFVMLMADWRAAISITVYFGLVLTVFQLFTRATVSKAGADFRNGSIAVSHEISNLTNVFREALVLGQIPHFLNRLGLARAQVARAGAINHFLTAIPRQLVELALIFGALAFSATQFLPGVNTIEPVAIGIFLMGSLRIMSSLLPLQRAFAGIRFESLSAASAQNLLEQVVNSECNEPDFHSRPLTESQYADRATPDICFRDVSFSYGGNTPAVLHGIDFSIKFGAQVAIVGPSGAGKSTLVDLLLGIHQPTSGVVELAGIDPQALRRLQPGTMGYVPQRPGLVGGTMRENIALGVDDADINEGALTRAVEDAGLNELVSSLPRGLETDLGKHLDELSGGQIQRIGLARALYPGPRLLVLDEATSALDAETEANVTSTLNLLRGKVTVVLVAHRLSTVRDVDELHLIVAGRLAASGTFSELKNSSELFRKFIHLLSLAPERG